jgi:hypothetical protein
MPKKLQHWLNALAGMGGNPGVLDQEKHNKGLNKGFDTWQGS